MSLHFERETEKLKKKILHLSAVVEESLRQAVKSLSSRDEDLARKIVEGDFEVDKMEVDVEEDCLKILALYQPVAIDLRFIISVLKIDNELERIGDLAVNIAERALFLADQPPLDIPFDFQEMTGKAKDMVKLALDALVNMDAGLAHRVRTMDDELDAMNRKMYQMVQEGILKQPDRIQSFIHLLSVSRHLERIGDHATNIAEDVIYMTEGRIVRHKSEDYVTTRTEAK